MSELQLESTQAFDEAFDNMLEKDTTIEKRLSSPSMLPLGNVNIDINNNITDPLIQTTRKTSSRADSRNQMHSTATKEPMTQRRSKRTKRQDPEIQSINEETNNSDNNDDNQTEMVTDNEHIEKEKQNNNYISLFLINELNQMHSWLNKWLCKRYIRKYGYLKFAN